MLKAVNDVPMGFADYRYEAFYYPKFYLAEMGNLVFHSEHQRGGHLPALDNPPEYVGDIQQMARLLVEQPGIGEGGMAHSEL
ncbi:hypothetical protein FRC06_010213 [Ceratobasidium sp. 370]|nr:hypothetical protein FRC06_010213 [Ceratobasidium sp. 370]